MTVEDQVRVSRPTGGAADRAGGLDDSVARGSLTIADTVVEKIAVIASGGVDGVAEVGSRMERRVGRGFPRAQARVAGDRVRISVEIAVIWPAVLATVAKEVRDRVTTQVGSSVGYQVDAVDVTAGRVVAAVAREVRSLR